MSNVHRIRDRAEIDEEAARWVWRLDAEDLSAETRAAYKAWLKVDPRHACAIEEYSKIWDRLDDLAVVKSDSKIKTVRRGVNQEERQRRFPVPLGWARYGAVAAVLFVAIVSTLVFINPGVTPDPVIANYATAVGQQRPVTLFDGSIANMNTNSIIEVDYSGTERIVRLEKGEVYFTVAKNPERPFIVEAGDMLVRAVGTAFSVYITPGAPVQVIVTEGTVEVTKTPPLTQEGPPSPQAIVLEAGEALGGSAALPGQVSVVSEADIAKELAWRRGMLVFEGDSLEFVVEELSRYTQARFIIVDDSIRQRRVGGNFKTDDVEGLLSVLEEGLSIEVRRQGTSIILLADADKN